MHFLFTPTAPTEIYTLSLHDALPICAHHHGRRDARLRAGLFVGDLEGTAAVLRLGDAADAQAHRSEEHTSELQSQSNLVCRLLLEKKKFDPQQLLSDSIAHLFHPPLY